jgi:hypothetical protein
MAAPMFLKTNRTFTIKPLICYEKLMNIKVDLKLLKLL